MRSTPKERSGFTLIEVLIAIAILATAGFVLLDAHHAAMRLYTQSHDIILERGLMELALFRAETEVMAGQLGGSGDFGDRYEDYSYSFEAQPLGDDFVDFYEVRVILEKEGQEPREITLFVYLTGNQL